MTTEQKAKAYEMALDAARKELGVDRKEWEVVQQVLHNIFPELRESEDERVRAVILKLVLGMRDEIFTTADKLVTKPKVLSWLEKHKESSHISESCKENAEYFTSQCGDNRFELIDKAKRDIIAKTNIESSPDEMKVLDSFLFRAWQMGWLGKYDVILPEQKPAWSEEDEKMLDEVLDRVTYAFYEQGLDGEIEDDLVFLWLHKLRPSWKPSEEQMEALMLAIEGKCPPTSYMSRRLEDLYDGLANTFGIEGKLK